MDQLNTKESYKYINIHKLVPKTHTISVKYTHMDARNNPKTKIQRESGDCFPSSQH